MKAEDPLARRLLTLLTAWTCSVLVGVMLPVPFLGLLALPLLPVGLIAWLLHFAGHGRRAVSLGATAGVFHFPILVYSAAFLAAELLRLERRVYLEAEIHPGLYLWPMLFEQVGPRLPRGAAFWLADAALLGLALRVRGGWPPVAIVLICAAFLLIPALLPFLILLLDLPLTA